jgi:hypothetical protein
VVLAEASIRSNTTTKIYPSKPTSQYRKSSTMSTPTLRQLPRRLRPSRLQCSHKITLLSPRSYHSYDRPTTDAETSPFPPTESKILRAALPHVPEHGFTLSTLSLGAQEVGYIPAAINLFPKGAFSLVHYHLYTQRLALKNDKELVVPPADVAGQEPPKGVGRRVKALAWERLMGNREVIHKLPFWFCMFCMSRLLRDPSFKFLTLLQFNSCSYSSPSPATHPPALNLPLPSILAQTNKPLGPNPPDPPLEPPHIPPRAPSSL